MLPEENTSRLMVSLQAGLEIPEDVAEWLNDGLQRFRLYGVPLEEALGFTMNYPQKLKARNECLCEAAALLYRNGMSDRKLAKTLEKEIERFKRTVWEQVQDLHFAPNTLTPVQQCLFRAFKTGIKVTLSERQLINVCSL